MGKIERLNYKRQSRVVKKINEIVDMVNSLNIVNGIPMVGLRTPDCDSKDFPACRERLAKEPEKPVERSKLVKLIEQTYGRCNHSDGACSEKLADSILSALRGE